MIREFYLLFQKAYQGNELPEELLLVCDGCKKISESVIEKWCPSPRIGSS